MTVELTVDGVAHTVVAESGSLLDVLRDEVGALSAKDGCSPQGQCGCCTVLVDGAPRVACVTPVRRVAGRSITTVDGLDADVRDRWAGALCASGGSQCGFCTPGIVVRLEGARAKGVAADDRKGVGQALAAHLCRCTGWQTVEEAYAAVAGSVDADDLSAGRDLDAAARRAAIEGRAEQLVAPGVALGRGGFAQDTAPPGALVAVPDGRGGWTVGETLAEARAGAGKVQGRRTTIDARPPLALPDGEWDRTLRTSWVEPAYLETDASWCEPGGEPATPLANGGAFGAKRSSPAPRAARALADEHGRAVRVVLSREDTVRMGPKRPPLAVGVRRDGTGVVRVARTAGGVDAIARWWPGLSVEEVDVPGPPTSLDLRGAIWVELAAVMATLDGADPEPVTVTDPDGGRATVAIGADGHVSVTVAAGDPLDEVVLRSYAIGAVHQALGWVTSEALAVDDDGEVHDLTIRSFGIVRALDMPPVDVVVDAASGPPVNGSDAVLAAAAAAIWRRQGCPPAWPTRSSTLTTDRSLGSGRPTEQ